MIAVPSSSIPRSGLEDFEIAKSLASGQSEIAARHGPCGRRRANEAERFDSEAQQIGRWNAIA